MNGVNSGHHIARQNVGSTSSTQRAGSRKQPEEAVKRRCSGNSCSGTTLSYNCIHVDDRIKAQRLASIEANAPLPLDFKPGPWSVICGRGKECYNHVGNRRFRILCDLNLAKYQAAKSKMAKSVIVMSIVDAVREGSRIGGFVKWDENEERWHEISDAASREKVGQQLRENLIRRDPLKSSAHKEKKRRNREQRARGPSGSPEDPKSVKSCNADARITSIESANHTDAEMSLSDSKNVATTANAIAVKSDNENHCYTSPTDPSPSCDDNDHHVGPYDNLFDEDDNSSDDSVPTAAPPDADDEDMFIPPPLTSLVHTTSGNYRLWSMMLR